MSLAGRNTQDRLIKREEQMERGKRGIGLEISTLVSGRVTGEQIVRSMTCKMMAHTVSAST
jgi:hypothetical protein